jgi:hypothetical protein
MIRKIVKLAAFVLVANALYQVTPVALRRFQFKDALEQLALYAQKSSDAELVERAVALAAENNVPLQPEDVVVRHEPGAIHIQATYVETLRFLPRYDYQWQFDIDAKAVDLRTLAPLR